MVPAGLGIQIALGRNLTAVSSCMVAAVLDSLIPPSATFYLYLLPSRARRSFGSAFCSSSLAPLFPLPTHPSP